MPSTSQPTSNSRSSPQVLRFCSDQAHRRKIAFGKSLPFLVFIANMIILSTFSIDPSFFYHGDSDRSLSWANATVPLKFMRVIRFSRALFQFDVIVFSISAAVAIVFFLVMALQIALIWSGKLGNRSGFAILKFLDTLVPVLTPIMLNVFLLSFLLPATGNNVAIIVVSAVSTFFLVLLIVQNSVLFAHFPLSREKNENTNNLTTNRQRHSSNDYRPSTSPFSVSSPRCKCVLTFIKVCLVTLDVFINKSGAPGARSSSVTAYAVFCLASVALYFSAHVTVMPFFRTVVNNFVLVITFGTVFSGVLSLVATLVSPSVGPPLALAAAVGIVPVGFLGLLIGRFRMTLIKRRFRMVTSDSTSADIRRLFKWPFEVDLATRFAYTSKALIGEDIARAEAILKAAIHAFSESPFVRTLFALFIGEVKKNVDLMKKELIRAKSLKAPFDLDFQIFSLYSAVRSKDSDSQDLDLVRRSPSVSLSITTRSKLTLSLEQDLSMAKLHHSAAKKAMTEFWTKVTRMRKNLDPEPLLSTVNTIDHHEQMALSIFKKLTFVFGTDLSSLRKSPNSLAQHRSENSRSANVLRAYAFFLQDIVDDAEQAEQLYQTADEIEDAEVQARRRREAKKKKEHEKAGAGAVSIVEIQPEDGVELSIAPETRRAHIQVDPAVAAPSATVLPGQVEESAAAQQTDDERASEKSYSTIGSSASASGGLSDARNKILQYRTRIASTKSASCFLLETSAANPTHTTQSDLAPSGPSPSQSWPACSFFSLSRSRSSASACRRLAR